MPGPVVALLAAGGIAAGCAQAAAVAERRWAIPAGLLLAIGRVESGRRDPATGRIEPWPYSADVAGQDYVFRSAAEAGAVLGFLRARGIGSIDVGCFQVNLLFHPQAFARPADGFEPAANADYAARFLRRLFDRSGNWETAIGRYHSADPALAEDYRARVLRAWLAPPPDAAARSDPHVILAAAGAAAIPVYTPQTLPPALRPALGPALGPAVSLALGPAAAGQRR